MLVFFCEGGKPENPEKNPRKKRREPTQTQPTDGVGSGNRTRATVVGGECSHHYTVLASPTSTEAKETFLTLLFAASRSRLRTLHQISARNHMKIALERIGAGLLRNKKANN